MSERRNSSEKPAGARSGGADQGVSGERAELDSRPQAQTRPGLPGNAVPPTQRSPGSHEADPETLVGKTLVDRYRVRRLPVAK